jgi:hypothetical protein
MLCEKVITHKYKKQIDKLCFSDESATKIINWVNNTVDGDAAIPQDEKMDHYLKESDIRDYKKILTEKAINMALKITGGDGSKLSVDDVPVSAVQILDKDSDIRTSVVSLSESRMIGSIIEKDVERNLLDVNASLQNLLKEAQENMRDLKRMGPDDIPTQRIVLGYVTEIRNAVRDYSKILGVEEYLKEKAKASAMVSSQKNVLTEDKKMQLMELLREVLSDVATEKIPGVLCKLEGIIGDVDANIHKPVSTDKA